VCVVIVNVACVETALCLQLTRQSIRIDLRLTKRNVGKKKRPKKLPLVKKQKKRRNGKCHPHKFLSVRPTSSPSSMTR